MVGKRRTECGVEKTALALAFYLLRSQNVIGAL